MKEVKILRDTPMHNADSVISINEFLVIYGSLFDSVTDEAINNYATGPSYKLLWFKVIEEPRFKVGDWIWHEKLRKAFNVIDWNIDTIMKPNECTISAANTYPDVYKRHANSDEIKYYTLHLFCDDTVLIGQSECYYFNHIWKPIINVYWIVNSYIQALKTLRNIEVLDSKNEIENGYGFQTKLHGLKVGCQVIYHDDVMKIAKILKLIP